jgi:putative ABC transport system permease protein
VQLPRAVPLAWRLIVFDRLRFGITVAGIGVSVVLILFLIALYDGIRRESNGYFERRPIAAWVAQENTTNFIKSSSYVSMSGLPVLDSVPGVAAVTPLVRLITTLDLPEAPVSVIVLGIDSSSTAGVPDVSEGRAMPASGEVVLDGSLARRHHLAVGDSVTVQGHRFRIVGMSRGTNSVLTQFAFIALSDAHELAGASLVASFFLVRAEPGVSPDSLAARLTGRVPRTRVLTRDTFAANNLHELQDGLFPILIAVAVIGGTVALIVLTLLLSGAILEQRETYAVLKAIGASPATLTRVVVGQALAAVLGGVLVGLLLYVAGAPLVLRLVPVLALALQLPAAVAVAGAALVVGIVGALIPLWRVGRIHPAELFRA